MKVRTAWPWISLLLAVFAALNPVGLGFIHTALFAGEQLARNIAGPIVLLGVGILAIAVLIEWTTRAWLIRRNARVA